MKFAKTLNLVLENILLFSASQDFISMFAFNLSSSFMPFIILIRRIKLFWYIKYRNITFYSHSDWREYFQWFWMKLELQQSLISWKKEHMFCLKENKFLVLIC